MAYGTAGTGAPIDPDVMRGLVETDMIQVNDTRRVVLTARGEMAYARLTDDDSTQR